MDVDGQEDGQFGRDPAARLTLSVEETAKLLGVSRTSAYEAVRRGELPVVRIGRRLLVPRSRLAAVLDGKFDGSDNNA